MDGWVLWIVAAVVLGSIELFAAGTLVFGMLAVGSAAAGLTMLLSGSEVAAWAVFGVVSAAMVGIARPIAARHLRTPIGSRMGAAALVGVEADVLEAVDGRDGRIKLKGEIWSARAFDGRSQYAKGDVVSVLQIDGATALVG